MVEGFEPSFHCINAFFHPGTKLHHQPEASPATRATSTAAASIFGNVLFHPHVLGGNEDSTETAPSVPSVGFEPTTYRLEVCCSIR